MTVLNFQSIMLPLLRYYGDGQKHSVEEALDELAKGFELEEIE